MDLTTLRAMVQDNFKPGANSFDYRFQTNHTNSLPFNWLATDRSEGSEV